MKNISFFLAILSTSILGALIGAYTYGHFVADGSDNSRSQDSPTFAQVKMSFAGGGDELKPFERYFVEAAAKVTPSVVSIKTTYRSGSSLSPIERMFRDFYGEDPETDGYPRQASGSGVIISSDGYIVTNYHVIEGAEKVEVILNDRREYVADIVGEDPSTDIALIKIGGQNLPMANFGNSDRLQIGQWALAIGSPFELASTVTAGIISAKGRNINLLQSRSAASAFTIESFIQTDAAVNPGNSGGALIDLNGNLIGINTAIASETGSYAGYSFAVPALLVEKVVQDLRDFGKVKRGLLGVSIRTVDAKTAGRYDLNGIRGVLVIEVSKGSGAAEAGVRAGDVIVSVDAKDINSSAELQEAVGRRRPGDQVSVEIARESGKITIMVKLMDKDVSWDLTAFEEMPDAEFEISELGAGFAVVQNFEKKKLDIDYGLKIVELRTGILMDQSVKEGFIITDINNIKITSKEQFQQELKELGYGGVQIEGVYPDGNRALYNLGF